MQYEIDKNMQVIVHHMELKVAPNIKIKSGSTFILETKCTLLLFPTTSARGESK